MITDNSFDVLCLTETWLKPNDYIGLNESTPPSYCYKHELGLLDYDQNHNHDYFGQYCNHDYLTRLIAGRITFFFMQI